MELNIVTLARAGAAAAVLVGGAFGYTATASAETEGQHFSSCVAEQDANHNTDPITWETCCVLAHGTVYHYPTSSYPVCVVPDKDHPSRVPLQQDNLHNVGEAQVKGGSTKQTPVNVGPAAPNLPASPGRK